MFLGFCTYEMGTQFYYLRPELKSVSLYMNAPRFPYSTCGSHGLWACEDSSANCMGTCTVTGNSVLTFDGMSYAFRSESCSLTLLQDQVGSQLALNRVLLSHAAARSGL